MSGNSEQVKAIQQALKDQGHDPGEIDGIMGPKTEAALRDYQQKQGLKATGHLDAETSAKLGVEAKTSAAPSSSSTSPAASPSTGASAPSDTKAKSDSGMKSDSSTKSDATKKSGETSAKPSDKKQQ
jgi:peptidoglycan hydrolase-like protein with peptidoglycan-binding domain